MKISERVELYYLEKNKRTVHKIKPITEIAAICQSCFESCKSQKGLTVCGKRTRERMRKEMGN